MNTEMLQQGLEMIRAFCLQNNINDILYNQKYLELLAAQRHGLIYNPEQQGADATFPNGDEVEIKCCKEGGSWQFHWLSNNKMDKIRRTTHLLFAIHDGYSIVRSYLVPTSRVLGLIEQKATGTANIGGHKSFSEKQLRKMQVIV